MTLFLRLAAAALFVALLGYVVTSPEALARVDVQLGLAMLAAQPLLVVAQLLIAWRLRMAVNLPRATYVRCMSASLLGQAADLVLPWRLSEFVRLAYLRQRAQVPISAGMATIVLERACDLVVVAALVVVASLAVAETGGAAFVAVAGAVTIGLLLLPRSAPLVERLLSLVPFAWLRRLAGAWLNELVARMSDGTFWRIIGPTVLTWISALGGTWIFLAVAQVAGTATAVDTLELALILFVATTLGNVVAVLPASIGTYEAAVIVVLGAYGMPLDQALTIGVALHLAQIAVGVLGGVAIAVFDPLPLRDILREARNAART